MKLTPEQTTALNNIITFLNSDTYNIFILKGYAGTGKTTLVREIIKSIREDKRELTVAASTGRAAHILESKVKDLWHLTKNEHIEIDGEIIYERQPISVTTLHSAIYTFDKVTESTDYGTEKDYELLFNKVYNENEGIMIVDEASMVSDDIGHNSFAKFGSGYLLKDLFESHANYKFIFVGDPAQLPPANQDFSPALTPQYLSDTYGKSVVSFTLTKIIRQAEHSGIIKAAQSIRTLYEKNEPFLLPNGKKNWPKFPIKRFDNIHIYYKPHLFKTYIDNILSAIVDSNVTKGLYNTLNKQILIALTNNHCFKINNYIREKIFYPKISPTELQIGDILQVTQNTHVFKVYNGNFIQILELGTKLQFAGLNFQKATIRELSEDTKKEVLLLTDILSSGRTNINKMQQRNMMISFIQKMKEQRNLTPKNKESFNEALRNDDFMNAVRAIYGYSITCHKAQGGEWRQVYVYTDKRIVSITKPYNWMYTAITRAQNDVYLNNDWYITY